MTRPQEIPRRRPRGGLLVLAACSGEHVLRRHQHHSRRRRRTRGVVHRHRPPRARHEAVTTMPATDAPTTTLPAGPVYPLTGLPVTDPAAAARPAMVVKIDNNKNARPQSGLNEADIVFEEIVEVQTRFAAVFHSQGSDPVGPIRSGRTQDVDLLGSFNKPLFVWSGGNPAVTDIIEASDLVELKR
ncbi:MAG: DUF3048 domain-containing protein [Ilumatobacteraceae bacterium]